jgi:hypothetical protein
MPRLTFDSYLKQRAFLLLVWEEIDPLFSLLSPNQQADLHHYYQPLHKYTDDHLQKHRAHVTKLDPSLPARAGKSYARLHRVYEQGVERAKRADGSKQSPMQPPRPKRTPVPASSRRITVRAVLRPEPDLHKLSQALIALARIKDADVHKRVR